MAFFIKRLRRLLLFAGLALLSLFLGACDNGPGTTTTYAVGDTGPAGGIVFYDNGSYTTNSLGNSWRYLECAPADLNAGITWGAQRHNDGKHLQRCGDRRRQHGRHPDGVWGRGNGR